MCEGRQSFTGVPNRMNKILKRKPNPLAWQASSLATPGGNNYLEERLRSRVEKSKGKKTHASGV